MRINGGEVMVGDLSINPNAPCIGDMDIPTDATKRNNTSIGEASDVVPRLKTLILHTMHVRHSRRPGLTHFVDNNAVFIVKRNV